MIDRVCFYIARTTANEAVFSNVSGLLEHKVTSIGEGCRLIYERGELNGLSITISEHRLTIRGSLTRFYTGSNVFGLRFSDIQDALQSLLSLLRIEATEATITEIEIGNAFCMDQEPKDYTKVLADVGYLARFRKEKVLTTLYYKQKAQLRALIFYDKLQEMESRKEVPPAGLQNLLRYEMTLRRSSLKKYLPTRTLKDLQDRAVFRGLLELWRNYFETIYKNATASATGRKGKTNLLLRFIYSLQIAGKTDSNELLGFVSENTRGSSNGYRLRKEIADFYTANGRGEIGLLSELRSRINEVLLNNC